jgi:hypothetical protein
MSDSNSNVIRMSKRDFFRLPDGLRQFSDGPMVLTSVGGRQTFVRVVIVELNSLFN